MTETTGGYAFAALIVEAEALTFAEFTFRDAFELGMHASKKALAADLPIIIQVTFGSRLAYFAALPGSSADSELWIQRKARVVERFGISTLAARVQYEEQGTTFAEATGLCEDEYAAHGGGYPILVFGIGVVGGIYASGLPQVEDHEFLVACLTTFRPGS